MNNRLLYIDKLKGFGIFLVVLGHVIQYNMVDFGQNSVFNAIYSFHMPFFFFLSGYIADKTTKIESFKDNFTFIKKKAISLLIPFFSWELVFKYCFTSETDFTIQTLLGTISNQFFHPGLWFLLSLFEIMVVYVFFYLISKHLNKQKEIVYEIGLFSAMIIFFLIINNFLSGRLFSFLLNLSFFFVGVFLSKFEILKSLVQKKTIYLASGLSLMVLIGHYNFIESNLSIMKGLKVIISISAIVFFYNLSKVLVIPKGFNEILGNWGKSTMVIYVTQFQFFTILTRSSLLPSDTSIVLLAIIAIPLSVILIYICIGFGKIAETIPILNLILYGKRISYTEKK